MKGWITVIFLLILLGCATTEETTPKIIQQGDAKMKLSSDAFKEGEMIPAKYTSDGEDINPQLKIEDVPAEAKRLALIVDDPDAPAGTWVHWLVKDIPKDTAEIKENSVPGTQVTNDFGKQDYGGPSPPSGVHRYFFKVYALDVESLAADNKADFYSQVEEHKIGEAVLMGNYTRS